MLSFFILAFLKSAMPIKAIKIFKTNYRSIYVGMLSIFVIVLPHSRLLLSMSEIGLVFFWVLEGKFRNKIQILKTRPEILIFTSIFLLHLVGLIYTQNFAYAAKDLRVKLPLLLFPIVIGTSTELTAKEIKLILSFFVISIIAKTLYGLTCLLGLTGDEISNLQKLAGKFSHIRYALLLNIAAFSMLYYLVFSKENKKTRHKILYVIAFIWLSFFVFLLHSVTGWVIWTVLSIFSFIKFALLQRNRLLKILYSLFSFLVIIGIIFYISHSVFRFYKTDKIIADKVEKYTKEGNKYKNRFDKKQKENGHFVWLYLCEKELKEEWSKRSKIEYSGKDKNDQFIKFTLIRYLTSKNLRKDKEGVSNLSDEDIKNIENGITNYIFADKFAVYPKIYEFLWQLNRYMSGGNPENQSVSQRLEFLKNGKEIIKRNFWTGVGTGDVNDEFKKQYELSNSRLSEEHRLRAHNQYVTIFIAFGFFGFIWFLAAYLYPVIKLKKFNSYLFLVPFIIMTLSMFNEDTLETQMGATVFAFFLSFFLFAATEESVSLSS